MTAVLAIYGAVLSSLVAAWSVYREITNRGRLRVIVTLADIGAACADYHEKHVRNVTAKRIQCDEIWQFVYCK